MQDGRLFGEHAQKEGHRSSEVRGGHEGARDICADSEEGAVTERRQGGVAGHQVLAKGCNSVRGNECEHPEPVRREDESGQKEEHAE